jgi:branched-chain amino acid transport system substrate-binding protein
VAPRIERRKFLASTAAALAASLPLPAIAENPGIRIGLLTVKTGPLAQGGIQMEQGIALFLKHRDSKIVGRPAELIVADTGGNPAGTKTKAQELIERDHVDFIVGPLAAFELLAISDHVAEHKCPILSLAAAEDMTQRKPNPWFTRGTSTSSQSAQPLADYCAKTLKYKRMITIADDIAYGHEMCAGFQRVFEDAGGKIVQKLFPPLTVPDYGTYIAQLKTNVDAIFLGFAGSNGFRFYRQFNEYGLRGKIAVVGGMTAFDEAVLRNMGDEALGIITSCWYSADVENAINKRFAANFRVDWGYDPGFYAAATYVEAAVLDATLQKIHGKIEDKDAFMKAVRSITVDTARGPVRFDHLGNVVGNVYIRKVERRDGRLVNHVIHTYPNVSQFWTYKEADFLKNPVYSRDWPPAKNLES